MPGFFNFPDVSNFREGVDYELVDWSFAQSVNHTPGTPCPPGHKMTFGLCRKIGGSGKWDPSDETDEEKNLRSSAKTSGSSFENNKAIESGGQKYGWAKKDGKDVLVKWGSVAGVKNKDGTVTKTPEESP
jgi:hypothetical protein